MSNISLIEKILITQIIYYIYMTLLENLIFVGKIHIIGCSMLL